MANDYRTEIDTLLDQVADRPEDMHELHAMIRERLNQMRATGMPLPEDLVALEAELDRAEREA
ncbi:hypothetical protein GCM10007989_14510 [Devosia pacifica]|uniref:Uncharacterized protein n=1 Tax=Devosia pacifica TaxID=1335967 RepID=A0A918S2F9_9HYPH|nr:hypothetical protein [Devosia pacifica]GHA20526.1 hypothetical protein GCM10007989_14510 [Devosia pacifica]